MTRFVREPIEIQFWSKVDRAGPDDCWEWTAWRHKTSGYGGIRVDGHLKRAHRVAYELVKGSIPPGLHVDHLCDNRGCVNPAHLEAVTQAENNRRVGERGRSGWSKKTHCPQGHAYDDVNTVIYDGRRYCVTCRRKRGREAGDRKRREAGARRNRRRQT